MHGILRTRNKKLETINKRNAFEIKCLLFKIYSSRLASGFSFIELLVVIAILGLLLSLTYASFSNFQKSTKLTNAALQLKSDLRFVQNKALAGDKSSAKCSVLTTPRPILIGWYMTITDESTTYTFNSDCLNNLGNEDPDSPVVKTLELPKGITVKEVGSSGVPGAQILFRPLVNSASIHSTSSPPFLNAGGGLINQISVGLPFEITLSSESGDSYKVTIQPSGEISEKKL